MVMWKALKLESGILSCIILTMVYKDESKKEKKIQGIVFSDTTSDAN